MTKRVASLLLVLLLLGLSLGSALAQKDEPDVKISPNTINDVGERSGRKLTVHADIPYSSVVPDTARLQLAECDPDPCAVQIAPKKTFADDQGDLVAKFDISEVLTKLISSESYSAGKVRLEFSVEKVDKQDGATFSGIDEVHLVTCQRASPSASFSGGNGAFKGRRTFSRVCEAPSGTGN